MPYDDPYIDGNKVPDPSPSQPSYYGWAAADLARPTIKAHIAYYDAPRLFGPLTFHCSGGSVLDIRGVIIDTIPDNYDPSEVTGWSQTRACTISGDLTSSVSLTGCVAVTSDASSTHPWNLCANTPAGDIPSMAFSRVLHLRGETLVEISASTAKISVSDVFPDEHIIKYLTTDLIAAVKNGVIEGIVRGPGGEPRNLMINVVV